MSDRVIGCTGKRRYSCGSDAKEAIKRTLRINGKRMHKYHCENCQGFHLTSEKVGVSLLRHAIEEELSHEQSA